MKETIEELNNQSEGGMVQVAAGKEVAIARISDITEKVIAGESFDRSYSHRGGRFGHIKRSDARRNGNFRRRSRRKIEQNR